MLNTNNGTGTQTNKLVNVARFIFSSPVVEEAVKEVIAHKYSVVINSVHTQEEITERIINARKQEIIDVQNKKKLQGTVAKLKKEVIERIQLLRKEKSIGGAIKVANQLDVLISTIKEVITMHGSQKVVRLGRYTKQELFGLVNHAFNAACGAK